MRKSLLAGLTAAIAAVGIAHAEPQAKPSLQAVNDVPRLDKMVAIFVTGPKCSTCDATEQLLVAKSWAMSSNFVLYKRVDSYVTEGALQLYLPGDSFAQYEAENLHPSANDIDAVVTGFNKIANLFAERVVVEKPFHDQYKSIEALETSARAPVEAKIKALADQRDQAIAVINKRYIDQNKAPLEKQLHELKKQKDDALKSDREKLATLQADKDGQRKWARLLKQEHNAIMAWDSGRETDLKKEVEQRGTALRAQYNSVYGDMNRIAADFDAKITPLENQIYRMSMTPASRVSDLDPQYAAERKKVENEFYQAADPLESASWPVTRKLFEAEQNVQQAQRAAIETFGPKISAAMDALDEIVFAETPIQDQK